MVTNLNIVCECPALNDVAHRSSSDRESRTRLVRAALTHAATAAHGDDGVQVRETPLKSQGARLAANAPVAAAAAAAASAVATGHHRKV